MTGVSSKSSAPAPVEKESKPSTSAGSSTAGSAPVTARSKSKSPPPPENDCKTKDKTLKDLKDPPVITVSAEGSASAPNLHHANRTANRTFVNRGHRRENNYFPNKGGYHHHQHHYNHPHKTNSWTCYQKHPDYPIEGGFVLNSYHPPILAFSPTPPPDSSTSNVNVNVGLWSNSGPGPFPQPGGQGKGQGQGGGGLLGMGGLGIIGPAPGGPGQGLGLVGGPRPFVPFCGNISQKIMQDMALRNSVSETITSSSGGTKKPAVGIPSAPSINNLADLLKKDLEKVAKTSSISSIPVTSAPAKPESRSSTPRSSVSSSTTILNPENKEETEEKEEEQAGEKPRPPSPAVERILKDPSITHLYCYICCKKNGRRCNGCKGIAYCSVNCQTKDWDRHKFECNPPVILEKERALKYLGAHPPWQVLDKEVEEKDTGKEKVDDEAENKKEKGAVLHIHPLPQCHLNAFKNSKLMSKEKIEFRTKISSCEFSPEEVEETVAAVAAEISVSPSPEESKEKEETVFEEEEKKEEKNDNAPPKDEEQKETKDEKEVEKYTGKMITRKEIGAGDLVACVTPIMMSCTYEVTNPNPPDSILCLNCTKWFQGSLGYRCSSCKWPICSLSCEKSYLHSNFECKVFSQNKVEPPPWRLHTQFYHDVLLILRCLLLKENDPSKYSELIELIDICKSLDKAEKHRQTDKQVIDFLKKDCKIDESLTTDFLHDFINVVDYCSMVVYDRLFVSVGEEGQRDYHSPKFVFPIKIFVTPDCSPNSKWSIKFSQTLDECNLRMHSTIPLTPLTYVTACFDLDKQVSGSWFHEDISTSSKFKNRCVCRRCVDPSELGTFFSGVQCDFCKRDSNGKKSGVLLPKDPLSRDSDWVCNQEGCMKTITALRMRKRILDFNNEIQPEMSEDFYALLHLKWRLTQLLHPNHFLFLKISVLCVMLFWGSVRGLPFFSPRYDFFISAAHLAHEALRIYNLVSHGMSLHRARILFQLQVAYAYRCLRDIRRMMEWGMDLMQDGQSLNFLELMKIQDEAYQILKTEPYGSPEYEMAIVLKDILDDQRDLLSTHPKYEKFNMPIVYNLHKIYTRFSNSHYYPAVPVYEDKDIQDFTVDVGPCARKLVEKTMFNL